MAFFDARDRLEFFGAVRGRAGLAIDRVLVYATGGFAWTAWGEDQPTVPGRAFFANNSFQQAANVRRAQRNAAMARDEQDDIRRTVGGGEYVLTDTISATVEGLCVMIGDNDRGSRIVGVTNTDVRIREIGERDNAGEIGLVRAGLNFHFGTW